MICSHSHILVKHLIIMTKQELLEEAKRRYPVGTRFIPAHLGDIDDYCIITDDTVLELMYDNVVAKVNGQPWLPKEEHYPKYGSEHNYNRNVYCDGKWAKVVGSLSHQDLLNEAYRRYPIGTKYISAADGKETDVYKVDEQSFRINITGLDIVQVFGEFGKGCLYYNGKWAEIVQESNVPTLDMLNTMYPVGTKFRPVISGRAQECEESVVEPGWRLYQSSENDFWFQDANGDNTHGYFIWESSYPDVYAEIVLEEPKKTGFYVGEKVLITKSPTNWARDMDQYDGKIATLVSIVGAAYFKIDLDGGKFSWSANDGHFVAHKLEPTPESIGESKFKLDDKVKVCGKSKCNGYGHYSSYSKNFDPIFGTHHDEGVITKKELITTPDGKKEWYYHLNCHSPNDYIAEHALTLISIDEIKDRLRERLKKKFPVGTRFRSITVDHNISSQVNTVKEDWSVQIGETGSAAWFILPNGSSAPHPHYIHAKGMDAAIVTELEPLKQKYDIKDLKDALTRQYPVGTQFIAVDGVGIPRTDSCPIVQDDWELEVSDDGLDFWYIRSDDRSEAHRGYVYANDKWAEITTPKSPAKKLTSFKSLPFTRI
jgi:hypothetical protein